MSKTKKEQTYVASENFINGVPLQAAKKKVKDLPKKVKGLKSRIVKFDAAKALRWLDFNTHNRPLTKSNVRAKAMDMENQCFMLTSQGLTIDWNGIILDGQHTLNAIILYYELCEESGIKPEQIELYVTEGEDPSHFPFYDQGKSRSTADVLSIDGVTNPKELAIALRLLWIRVNGKRVHGAGKTNPYTLKTFAEGHKSLAASVKFIMSFGQKEDSLPCTSLMSPGYAACLHYLMVNAEGCTKKDADKFWTDVIEQDAKKGTPQYYLYRKLNKIKSTKDMKLSRDDLVSYCIKAFNLMVDGEDVKSLRLNDGERPVLGGIDQSEVPEEEVDGDE